MKFWQRVLLSYASFCEFPWQIPTLWYCSHWTGQYSYQEIHMVFIWIYNGACDIFHSQIYCILSFEIKSFGSQLIFLKSLNKIEPCFWHHTFQSNLDIDFSKDLLQVVHLSIHISSHDLLRTYLDQFFICPRNLQHIKIQYFLLRLLNTHDNQQVLILLLEYFHHTTECSTTDF